MTYNTRAEIAVTAALDPEFDDYFQKQEAAKGTDEGAASAPGGSMLLGQLEDNVGKTIDIPMRDGYISQLRLHKPKDASAKTKVLVVLIFGGGFRFGDNAQLNLLAQAITDVTKPLCQKVGATLMLAPGHKFPAASNDTWDSLKWIAANQRLLGVDLEAGFVVGGVSAGANLSAASAQRWLDEKISPPITGQVLIIPLLLEAELVPTEYKELWFAREQNANAPVLDNAAVEDCLDVYSPVVKSPDFSPFNSKTPHVGLAPVYIAVCGMDPLRDDGIVYHRVLEDNGVRTKLDVYPGVPHSHFLMRGLKSAKKAAIDMVKAVGWIIGDERSDEEVDNALTVAGYPE